MNNTFKLGRSIALLVQFYRKLHKKREEIFSKKILIIMLVVAIVKIAVLILWI